MSIMVTGANGQLGYEVCAALAARAIPVSGVDYQMLDIVDTVQVDRVFAELKPDGVIHCAAMTAVDQAESDPLRCREVNVLGTKNLARACVRTQSKMILISSDYVFNGEGLTPYETDTLPNPLNVYGKSKMDAEAVVQEILNRFFIIRTSWLFGAHGKNFVTTMLKLGRSKPDIRVVADQVGSPTYAKDLAGLLCDIIQTEKYGIYHATNEGFCSWFTFAEAIMCEAGISCRVSPVETAQYATPAKRPLNSRLSKRSLADAGFRRLPDWQDALHRYYEEIRE